MLFGTEEQKKKYLPQISSGKAEGIWCTGYSEPDAGSDFASLQTSAERQGDGYIINGQKVWNSAGHRAKWCWLACRTDPNAKRKHDGISLFIVDLKSEGVKVQPIPNVFGAEIFNEVIFKDVKVPVENLVGKENEGWSILMQALAFERGLAILSSSILKRYLDELVVYAKETGAIKRPEIRKQLVDLAIEYRTLRVLALEEIWKEAKGDMIIHEPARNKAYSDEVLEKFAMFGTELIGAYSQVDPLIKDNKYKRLNGILEWLYWIVPGAWSGGGTQDIMRNIVAQFGLGLPNK
jgi:alkylation response protein AidB-like acyl-CoA dehydrogenase